MQLPFACKGKKNNPISYEYDLLEHTSNNSFRFAYVAQTCYYKEKKQDYKVVSKMSEYPQETQFTA